MKAQYLPQFDSLIFDLDGTLWDASDATAKAWSKIAKGLGLELQLKASDIRSVSGLPFHECVKTLFADYSTTRDLNDLLDQAEQEEILLNGGSLYPLVREGLLLLSKQYKIFLVSNCQDWYLEAFFKHSGLEEIFVDSVCFGHTGRSKAENIRNLTAKYGLKEAVYIGDTHWDQHASYDAGVKFIFSKYGFGNIDSDSCPTVNSFDELVEILSVGKYVAR